MAGPGFGKNGVTIDLIVTLYLVFLGGLLNRRVDSSYSAIPIINIECSEFHQTKNRRLSKRSAGEDMAFQDVMKLPRSKLQGILAKGNKYLRYPAEASEGHGN